MTIEFNHQLRKREDKTIKDVLNLLVNFLHNNGFLLSSAQEGLRIEENAIRFTPNYANSDLTQGIGLMFLLFTARNKYGYVEIRDKIFINIKYGQNWNDLYYYLESMSNITIKE